MSIVADLVSLNKNEILLLEDFSDYHDSLKFHSIIDQLHLNERFSIIIDHRNNTTFQVNQNSYFIRDYQFQDISAPDKLGP